MADKLNIYSKDNLKTPIATGDDTTGAKVTGLAAGTKVMTAILSLLTSIKTANILSHQLLQFQVGQLTQPNNRKEPN